MIFGGYWSDRWTGGSVQLVGADSLSIGKIVESPSPDVLLCEVLIGTSVQQNYDTSGWPISLGNSIYGAGASVGFSNTGDALLQYSDKGWIGAPNDSTFPNTPYDARVLRVGAIRRSFSIRPWESPLEVWTFGFIEFANADGELDALRSQPANGRRVSFKMGVAKRDNGEWIDYEDLTTLFNALGGNWNIDTERARLSLRSLAPTLSSQANTEVYSGGGGIDGTSELEGLPRPVCYGQVFNISPPLVDPNYLVYQIHDGPIEAVDAVRDRGAALVPTSDYSTYGALTSASLITGQYATALNLGLLRIGSRASGILTVDARGDNDGGYIDSAPAILDRYLCFFKGIGECGPGKFDRLPTDTIGIWTGTTQRTTLSVVQEIVVGTGGALGENRSGDLMAFELIAPENLGLDWVIEETDIIEISPLTTSPPIAKVDVQFRRNYTVQDSDIAGSVSADNQGIYGREWQIASELTSAGSFNLAAVEDAIIDSVFWNSSAAEALAQRMANLHGKEREIWNVRLGLGGMDIALGSGVEITHPRIDTGKRMQVIRTSLELESATVLLTLWG